MKAWSSTGKFRGDILNNGNEITFDPLRFNMFYKTLPNYGGMPGIDYTLQYSDNLGLGVWHKLSDVPADLRGAGITMIIAGILALSFIGFSGMVAVQ